ncbi:TetR/AcrR family transcriptional regulator [Streptomyces sp. AK02-01A]|uniref:TetR/AcrR family transcriptional regulator n=1 Tax=Streptomyces sp. AK02-01A TaxID=3028648 RepID=UPI0029BCA6F8|nr:TetR family transcriptional regulator [Streptomyces sp. AK02-01A]MDX3852373.1 TetR family transcriptional regulator [Streptomyces sp. AK02-01A]
MTDRPGFQRAYSPEHKAQRAADLMEAARTLAAREGVRGVTLTAIAQHAGVHVSAVRRYYASREEILLNLAEEGYNAWSRAVVARFTGRAGLTSVELARTLVATFAERPLFCDLLTHVTLSLEREVSYERVRAFKYSAGDAVAVLTDAVAAASALDGAAARELITGTIALAASLWQAGHPGDILTRLYREEPAMAHIGIDFEPALTRLLTALCDGLTGDRSALETAEREA